MNEILWVWMGLLIVFGILEACTVSMVSIWFVGGAAAAMIANLLDGPIWLQIVLFLAVSGVLLVIFRPLARKYVNNRRIATNADSNLGRETLALERVDNLAQTGCVRLGGVVWSVRSRDGQPIEADTLVKIVAIEGSKLLVEPVGKE